MLNAADFEALTMPSNHGFGSDEDEGVDSSVVTLLDHKAFGDRLKTHFSWPIPVPSSTWRFCTRTW